MIRTFKLAGACDDCQRAVIADAQTADIHICHGYVVTCSRKIDAVSDSIR